MASLRLFYGARFFCLFVCFDLVRMAGLVAWSYPPTRSRGDIYAHLLLSWKWLLDLSFSRFTRRFCGNSCYCTQRRPSSLLTHPPIHHHHQGGVAFMKTPAGRIFYDHFNENLFRSDTGIERTQLGSLLDHMGAIGKSEEYAAQVTQT
jgi:hypothetical protein